MPFVQIIEQPTSVGVRFRYPCEARSAGCIRGVNSTEKDKTYPTIQVFEYQGPACCIASCVAKEGPPHLPHPYNLVGKNVSENGVCYREIDTSDMTCSFPQIGIQCVKKNDIKQSLAQRQRLKIDPFGTGFSHATNSSKINLSCVRICFQVFIADSNGKLCVPLHPVTSDVIFDNKVVSNLAIAKLSHYSDSVIGGQEIILLGDQINKDDIEVVFYEEKDGQVIWLSHGEFSQHNVHRKAAISLTVPEYKSTKISRPTDVLIQLRRPSDGIGGIPKTFTYFPLKHDPEGMLRKKQKYDLIRLDMKLESASIGDILVPRTFKKAVRKIPHHIKECSDRNQHQDLTTQQYEEVDGLTSPWCTSQPSEFLLYDVSSCAETHLYLPQNVAIHSELQDHSRDSLTEHQALNNNWICEDTTLSSNDLAFSISDVRSTSTSTNMNLEAFSEILNLSSCIVNADCYGEA